MENFAPGLRDAILGLTEALRFIVFFVAVVGLMLQVQRARADMESLARPIVRAVLVVGIIATLPHWFGFTEKIFLNVADVVNHRYTEHPMQAATLLRDSVAENPNDFSLRRVGESIYRASLWAAAKMVVLIASLLQLPLLLLQYLLKLLCYLFLPVALALMLVPSLTSLGVRYVQQTLAVLAWPVGFAVTELVAYHHSVPNLVLMVLFLPLLPDQRVVHRNQKHHCSAGTLFQILSLPLRPRNVNY